MGNYLEIGLTLCTWVYFITTSNKNCFKTPAERCATPTLKEKGGWKGISLIEN